MLTERWRRQRASDSSSKRTREEVMQAIEEAREKKTEGRRW
jgi:hypothetical protein